MGFLGLQLAILKYIFKGGGAWAGKTAPDSKLLSRAHLPTWDAGAALTSGIP